MYSDSGSICVADLDDERVVLRVLLGQLEGRVLELQAVDEHDVGAG